MPNQFGPWASSINTGMNPQLSSFWRRRMSKLVPASQTSPTLSRRNLLGLGTLGVLAGVLPTLKPAQAVAAENKPAADNDGEQSLPQVVAAFNKRAAENSIGRSETPLTEDEVVAALRAWDRKQMEVDETTYAIFQKIADTKKMPKNVKLKYCTGWTGVNGYDFTVWWVDLDLNRGDGTGYGYRIRDRKISCRPSAQK